MRTTIVLIAVLLHGASLAQNNYTFKVLVNKGQNEVKSGDDWRPIKVGASLTSVDELKVSQNGYLGLVHVTGKPLELKSAGQHKVVDLAAKVKGGSSVLNKYTDFILSSKEDKTGNQIATGAVHRGADEIKVYLPNENLVVYSDKVKIVWSKIASAGQYVVRLSSMFGDTLDVITVADTTATINLSNAKLNKEDNIIVEVLAKGDPKKLSEPKMLKKLSSADRKRLNNSFSQISQPTSEETALNKLLLASFFEENSLLTDAATAHYEAIQLAPNVPQFQEAYMDFLARNGLIR